MSKKYNWIICKLCSTKFISKQPHKHRKYCSRVCYHKSQIVYKTDELRNKASYEIHKRWNKNNKEKLRVLCREWYRKNKTKVILGRIELRKSILKKYGNKCICCGEKHYEFLAFDHVNGCGDKHRKKVGSGTRFLVWIVKNNYPKTIQILCHNCNSSKGYYGYCPHHKEVI